MLISFFIDLFLWVLRFLWVAHGSVKFDMPAPQFYSVRYLSTVHILHFQCYSYNHCRSLLLQYNSTLPGMVQTNTLQHFSLDLHVYILYRLHFTSILGFDLQYSSTYNALYFYTFPSFSQYMEQINSDFYALYFTLRLSTYMRTFNIVVHGYTGLTTDPISINIRPLI